MAPPTYNNERLLSYFDRIRFPVEDHASDRLVFLNQLVSRQLAYVPFETLSLHYSSERLVSLDIDDLFDKIVTRRRGGYCLENNALFRTVLRSLGYRVMSVVCRVSMASRGVFDGSWLPMSHVANVVSVGQQRYLVDVGYGPDGPCALLPLVSNEIVDGLPTQHMKLEYKSLPQHEDFEHKVWMYSQKRASEDWQEVYHFSDVGFLAADYDVLNSHVMIHSQWAKLVLAHRFVLDSDTSRLVDHILLKGHEVKAGNCQVKQMHMVQRLQDEQTRVEALECHFDISLTMEEKQAIKGRSTDLDCLLDKA